ncbi:hypothetical protein [Candidatus Odyssella acanthamoebae]|uniref:Single Cache domain-containing protein n=1 Tax=Candidatus Odyssella acanthamoebae TaxID=91604 RepID=A0A077AX50_9PROT|nr:hypothetical protein [Candidatus Paracaedibacter acanthamoebae]AIK97176.1 hypothetical protein ID47_11205 [Candidatus Paracaedibacter acanthamoebae]
MKKSMKLALAATVLISGISTALAGNQQTADEARDRMEMLTKLFQAKGLNSFSFLNGHDGAGEGKNRENQAGLQWAELTKSDDRKGHIICVENGNYAVNQLQPTKVGSDTMSGANTWRDGQGMPLTQKIIDALRNSSNGKAVVNYVETTSGVDNERQGKASEEKFELLAYSSAAILGKKNDSGSKFFCAVRYQQFEPTDESDSDRTSKPDHMEAKGKHAHKHHAKKHAKKAEAKQDAPAA